MNRFIRLFGGVLAVTVTSVTSATIVSPIDIICPIDGERFQAMSMLSLFRMGTYLDLMPQSTYGGPPPLPKCPSNGLVLYRTEFSADQLTRLKRYVTTRKYQTLQSTHADYYVAAQIQRYLGESPEIIANSLLHSTAQAKDRAQYLLYASEALEAYRRLLDVVERDRKLWVTNQLIAGELERRTGRFDAARQRFQSLLRESGFDVGYWHNIAKLQLKLVEARDTDRHLVPK